MSRDRKPTLPHEEMAKMQKEAARIALERAARFRSSFNTILLTKEGRHFVFELLERGAAFDRQFIPDADARCYRDGQQAFAMFIFNELTTHNQAAYLKMLAENRKETK